MEEFNASAGTRSGPEDRAASASSALDAGRLGGVLLQLQRERWSGVLQITSPGKSAALGFRDGTPVTLDDAAPGHTLVDQLVDRGQLTREQRNQVLASMTDALVDDETVAFFEHAVQLGFLTEDEAKVELSSRVRAQMIQLFSWKNCETSLTPGVAELLGRREFPQKVGELVYMGVRTFYEEELLQACHPDLSQTYVRLTASPATIVEFFGLDDEEHHLLRRIQPDDPAALLVETRKVERVHLLGLLMLLRMAQFCEVFSQPQPRATNPRLPHRMRTPVEPARTEGSVARRAPGPMRPAREEVSVARRFDLPPEEGSAAARLPRAEGSVASRLPRGEGSVASRLPRGEGSVAGRFDLPPEEGSTAARLPRAGGSVAGRFNLPREESSVADRLPHAEGSVAGRFNLPREEGSVAGRFEVPNEETSVARGFGRHESTPPEPEPMRVTRPHPPAAPPLDPTLRPTAPLDQTRGQAAPALDQSLRPPEASQPSAARRSLLDPPPPPPRSGRPTVDATQEALLEAAARTARMRRSVPARQRSRQPGTAADSGSTVGKLPNMAASYTNAYAPKAGAIDPSKSGSFDPSRSGSFDPSKSGSFDPSRSGSFDPSKSGSFDPSRSGSFDPNKPETRPEYAKAHLKELIARRKLTTGGPEASALSNQRDPARELREARSLLQAQHFARAEKVLGGLIELEPANELYKTYHLWARWRTQPEAAESLIPELQELAKKLISDSEHGGFAAYVLGHVFFHNKRDDLAERFFKRAHAADRNNKDAERHLLILERRKHSGAEGGAGGHRKLFGIQLPNKPKP